MKKYSFIFCFMFLFFIFTFPIITKAANPSNGNTNTQSTGLACPGANCTTSLTNPLSVNTPQALIGKIINAVLGVVGSLALLMFVYGGLTWMTSSGSQEKIKKGRDIIVWSIIGLAIIFASYGLVRILLNTVK